ncbi:MAG TPA: EAL domain-containing protein [Acidobacteriota bacterium]|nr:EAL domain-containing protein [Acidobacteriota bacterium]HVO96301.1 EAL domain-containing protein [Terriglobales bacterium]
MSEPIRTYHEHIPILKEELVNNGSLSLVLLDISPFTLIEEQYGIQTYSLVRHHIFSLLKEQSGKDFRKEDMLVLEEPGGFRILLFLSPRRHLTTLSYESLEAMRLRLMEALVPKLLRTASPYLKTTPRISIGYAIGIYNPLMDPHHNILRMIREAIDQAQWQQKTEEINTLKNLREVILNEEIITLYQPIVNLRDGQPVAYEALARGNAGSTFPTADKLFDAAIRHHLLVELDRVCRKQALHYSHRLPSGTKVFINTLPATIRDPEFQGKHLVESLERAYITPDRIVIEITEKMVIDNLNLFLDAMTDFTALGMSFAVDDVGSGYSGLETIGKLKPSYLKVDMSLVQGIHTSIMKREMLNAIISMGRGIGAKVIAEGIEVPEELKTLQAIGVDYGQGYLLGRPDLMSTS